MNRKAIIFVETDRMLDGVSIPLVKISGVPLLKRVLIDPGGAGFQEVSVVFDKPHAQLEQLVARQNPAAHVVHSSSGDWSAPLLRGAAVGTVILLADRLYDFRILAALRESPLGAHDSIVAVDLASGEKIHEAEQRFTPYNGSTDRRARACRGRSPDKRWRLRLQSRFAHRGSRTFLTNERLRCLRGGN